MYNGIAKNERNIKSKIESKITKRLSPYNEVIVSGEVPSVINKLLPVSCHLNRFN